MKQGLPLISIILPVYNGEKFLANAIESCLLQTYSNFELIIVNDFSTDQTFKIIEDFQSLDTRIKVINNSKNLKLPKSLNIGHEAAVGEFITWTSDDNILKPEFLSSLLKSITKENCDIVFSNYDIIWEDGKLKRTHTTGPLTKLLFGDFIGASFLYKMDVFRGVKGYDENLFLVEDYHFFLKASLKFRFFHLNKNLYQYRIHKDSLTGQIHNDSTYKEHHKRALMLMYKDISHELDLSLETIELIIDLYFNNSISIKKYLKNFNVLKKDIENFEHKLKISTQIEYSPIHYLKEGVRKNWLNFKKEQSFINLFKVLLNQNSLLFNSKFNRNATIKLIYLCLT